MNVENCEWETFLFTQFPIENDKHKLLRLHINWLGRRCFWENWKSFFFMWFFMFWLIPFFCFLPHRAPSFFAFVVGSPMAPIKNSLRHENWTLLLLFGSHDLRNIHIHPLSLWAWINSNSFQVMQATFYFQWTERVVVLCKCVLHVLMSTKNFFLQQNATKQLENKQHHKFSSKTKWMHLSSWDNNKTMNCVSGKRTVT